MFRAEHPEIMWGLGLDPDTAALIEQSAGPGFTLRNLPPDAAGWMRGGEALGVAAWVPLAVWEALPQAKRLECRAVDSVRRVLILPADAESIEPEQVLAEGFLTAVRAPLTRFSVRDALLRLRELDSLSADLRRKTEEVMLERELLARKSQHLSFLNRVLSRASSSLDPATILTKVRTDLGQLLPVDVMCAIFWTRSGQALEAELFMHCPMPPTENTAWQEILLAAAERLGGHKVSDFRQSVLSQGRHLRNTPLPNTGRLLMLPTSTGGDNFGCLALMTRKGLRLAKDEVVALNAAVNHLGLAMRNAMLFRQMKSMADHDGLTQIANRRHFEESLRLETMRHGRYGQPLSLILLDLDHFKNVNDTHGHQAGDSVLRQISNLLVETLRGTDLPARYGGEEFAVILPHTSQEQAAMLAERIRTSVEGRDFSTWGKPPLLLTVSAGVATLSPESDGIGLVALADQALYLAKEGGRNKVVVGGAKPQLSGKGKGREVRRQENADEAVPHAQQGTGQQRASAGGLG